MYDVVVIGAGPAGISAAIYATSRGLNTLVIEKEEVGGTLGKVSTVSHYTALIENESGATFAKRMREQAYAAGVEIRYEKVIETALSSKIKVITTADNCYEAKAIIIANGTTPRKLDIPGEEKLTGKGYGMNAAKDAEKYRNKNVYVIGGADGAIKEALYLAEFARKVTIVHFEDQLATIHEFAHKIKQKDNIDVLLHTRLHEVIGEEEINTIIFIDEHTKAIQEVKDCGCGIFVYAGATPNSEVFMDVAQEDGFIITNDKMETNIAGVYGAGDICKKQVRQAATAIADGAIAAINATNYIKIF